MWFSTDFTVGVANRPPIKVYSLENFRPISLKLFIGLKKLQLGEIISEVAFLMFCLHRYLHFHSIFCKYWNQGMLYDLLVSLLEIWRRDVTKKLEKQIYCNKTDLFIDPFPNNVISSKGRWIKYTTSSEFFHSIFNRFMFLI